MGGRRVAYCAMLTALALVFSYVEVLMPVNFAIPGVKLGLANIVILTGLYVMEKKDVLLILILRIMLSGLLFGNVVSLLYSLIGGLLSFCVMVAMKHVGGFSVTGVSMAGGIAHNVGQLLVAAWILKSDKVIFYLPVLLITGTIMGGLTGTLAAKLLPAVNSLEQKE